MKKIEKSQYCLWGEAHAVVEHSGRAPGGPDHGPVRCARKSRCDEVRGVSDEVHLDRPVVDQPDRGWLEQTLQGPASLKGLDDCTFHSERVEYQGTSLPELGLVDAQHRRVVRCCTRCAGQISLPKVYDRGVDRK